MSQANPLSEVADEGREVRRALEAFIDSAGFSCVGGKAASRRKTLVQVHLPRLADPNSTRMLHGGLVRFARREDPFDELFDTFIATFSEPRSISEEQFEALLWRQLQLLHDFDSQHFSWAQGYDKEPDSPRFGFSVAEHPFFIVGLHDGASRMSRRFAWPALVFNSHDQFRRHRERGSYRRIQQAVRRNELKLQGSLNPNLADFGETSEARQYSGRRVLDEWRCPFTPTTFIERKVAR